MKYLILSFILTIILCLTHCSQSDIIINEELYVVDSTQYYIHEEKLNGMGVGNYKTDELIIEDEIVVDGTEIIVPVIKNRENIIENVIENNMNIDTIPRNKDIGDISYVIDDTMTVGITNVINLTISKNVEIKKIIEAVETFNTENTHSEPIRTSKKMKARLIPVKDVFKIVPITSEI
jgi:hypothetical protein